MKQFCKIHFTILLFSTLLLSGCEPIAGYEDYNIFSGYVKKI